MMHEQLGLELGILGLDLLQPGQLGVSVVRLFPSLGGSALFGVEVVSLSLEHVHFFL